LPGVRFESREAAEYLSPGFAGPHPAFGTPLPPARRPEDLCSKSNGYCALGRRAGGRGEGGEGGLPQPTALRRGLRYVAPSELTFAGNFGYRTLTGLRPSPTRHVYGRYCSART